MRQNKISSIYTRVRTTLETEKMIIMEIPSSRPKTHDKFQTPFMVISAFVFLVWGLYRARMGKLHSERFFKEDVSTHVIQSGNYSGRAMEYELENGMSLSLDPRITTKLMIGDSIYKDSNTYIYNIYRREGSFEFKYGSGEYKFWTKGDYNSLD